jgi:hypothetical protein
VLWLCVLPAGSMLDSLSAVQDAAETSIKGFLGLLLDNTKVRPSGLAHCFAFGADNSVGSPQLPGAGRKLSLLHEGTPNTVIGALC